MTNPVHGNPFQDFTQVYLGHEFRFAPILRLLSIVRELKSYFQVYQYQSYRLLGCVQSNEEG